MNNRYAIIMAGGVGSRFWPMSTSKHPKQFLDILGSGKTLLQQTYERMLKLCPNENIFVVTSNSYYELVNHQLPELPIAIRAGFCGATNGLHAVQVCWHGLEVVENERFKANAKFEFQPFKCVESSHFPLRYF